MTLLPHLMSGKRDKSPPSAGCNPVFVLGSQRGAEQPFLDRGFTETEGDPLWLPALGPQDTTFRSLCCREDPNEVRDGSTLPCALQTPGAASPCSSGSAWPCAERPVASRPCPCSTSKAFEDTGLEREDDKRRNRSQRQI